MTEKLKENIEIVSKYFQNFTNFIEVEDFRSFLLFTLTSQVSMDLMAQLGFGGSKEIINLPYSPIHKIYFQKINLFSAGTMIIYCKNDPLSDKFLLDKDNEIFKKYLNSNEISLAFRGKEKFSLPLISDCSALDNSKLNIKVDDLFHSMESFISYLQPNIVFVINAKSESEPDLVFTFNMMPQLPGKLDENVLKIDVYLDYKYKTKGITYIKREEDHTIKFLTDIKEVSHSELYKSSYSLVLRVKSFERLY
ncbi:MAG: hypothetical protein ACFFEO_16820 [Candidatus Thorarchaeota archaeon]